MKTEVHFFLFQKTSVFIVLYTQSLEYNKKNYNTWNIECLMSINLNFKNYEAAKEAGWLKNYDKEEKTQSIETDQQRIVIEIGK